MELFIFRCATEYSKSTKLLGKYGAEILQTRFSNAIVVSSFSELKFPCVLLRDDYPLVDKVCVQNAFSCLSQGKTYEKSGVFALYSPAQIYRVSAYPVGFTEATYTYYVRCAMEEVVTGLQTQGVTVINPLSLYVEYGVQVASGVVIYPNTYLFGNTKIEKNVTLLPGNFLTDTIVGEGSTLVYTLANGAEIGKNASVGPFVRLRQGTRIGDNARIGNFVEIKNSHLESGVKVAHHTYVGDAEIGKNTNVGCGVVFANYNGKEKQKTAIGENCFLGCNTNLIAPVTVGANSFIAAGTTVTRSVPKDSFVIGRPRQITKQKE